MMGWLYVNKAVGMTSFDVVARVRSILKVRQIGHAGTLDPLASGVLLVAVGGACKLIPYVQKMIKTYMFDVIWGESRDTDDAEGVVVQTSDHRPTQESVRGVLSNFLGRIQQQPPQYSAIKIQGRRAYALARRGVQVDMPMREVFIKALELVNIREDRASFQVVCGSGTYVRALGRDIALALNTCGYVDNLVRTQIGDVHQKACLTVDLMNESMLHPAESLWRDGLLKVDKEQWSSLMHGRCIVAQAEDGSYLAQNDDEDGFVVGLVQNCSFVPKRVVLLHGH